MRLSILAAVMLVQVGCTPWPYSYYLPNAERGTLVNKGPKLAGPSDAIVLEEQGYEITVWYRGELRVQLFVPEGKRLLLHEPALAVYYGKHPALLITYELALDNHGYSPNSHEFVGRPRTNIFQRNGTSYSASIRIRKPTEHFEIRLPSFEAPNGTVIEFSSIVFDERSGIAVMPIN